MSSRGGDFRRPRRDADHGPNHERWMISYADLLTLMLALFIVLYATSAQNTSKLKAMASSMMTAFSGTPPAIIQRPSSPKGPDKQLPKAVEIPVEAPPEPKTPTVPQNVHHLDMTQSPRAQRMMAQQQALQPSIKAISELDTKLHALLLPEIQAQTISLSSTPLTIKIRLKAKILFGNGDATLTKGADKILTPLASTLATIPKGYQIAIHGYTDDKPIHTPEFPSNWQLSTARALSVVLLFQQQGVAGEALSAEGFSKYHPIASNDTETGRQQNRRVSIVISAPKPTPGVDPDGATDPAPDATPEVAPATPPDAAPNQPADGKTPAPPAGPVVTPAQGIPRPTLRPYLPANVTPDNPTGQTHG
ncbi:flagellar motor protein MotD [Thioclava sp. BHET1]|nr:flagellar motor protein MotD [Thioclava sp. BHET1]